MQKITPCLWFNNNAEEAVKLYTELFDGKILDTTRYDAESAKVSGQPEGSVLTVEFELFGEHFTALNGGPLFKFTEATSFMVHCETQEEVDKYWAALSAVPESEQCGWCKDKYGLSWQIVPNILEEYLKDSDPKKAQAVMSAMLEMKKIEISKLEEAYNQA
jgi:predicted 3-demethylubiquinone-9 3-methyltransferase (glyoxalase superfamily)